MCGLTTAQIAAAFLVPDTIVAQRITRAKRNITDAGIPYRIPTETELPDRLGEVLTVIYLLFNEGYLSSTAEQTHSQLLAEDAEWLASELAWMMPREPEILGLLALIRLHEARRLGWMVSPAGVAAGRGDDGRQVELTGRGRTAVNRAKTSRLPRMGASTEDDGERREPAGRRQYDAFTLSV